MRIKQNSAPWMIIAAVVLTACGSDPGETIDESDPAATRPADTEITIDTTIDPPPQSRIDDRDIDDPDIDGVGECFVTVPATVFVDADATTERDEEAIAGVPVALFEPSDPSEPFESGWTGPDGHVEFHFIWAGDCDLPGFVLTLTAVPEGYVAPTIAVDMSDFAGDPIRFPLLPKPDLAAATGGDPCYVEADVSVWEDVDGDGVRDPDELPMRDVTVGFIRSGEEFPTYDLRTTGYDGTTKLGFVLGGPDGCEPDGHRIGVIRPPSGFLANEVAFDASGGGEAVAVSIGVVAGVTPDPDPRSCFRTVLGRVWEDRNADGVRTADEAWLEGVWVAARWPDGGYGPKDSARTSPNGVAEIGFSLRNGDCEVDGHTLDVVAPEGYLSPAAMVPLVDGDDDGATVVIEVGLVPDPDRGPQPEGALGPGECFRGLILEAFVDADENGRRDPGESPLFRVAAMLLRPDQQPSDLVGGTVYDTTPQGYAEIGVVVDNAECDLTGYSLVIVRAPAGTDLPADPIIELGAIDTGDEPLVIELGLPLRRS